MLSPDEYKTLQFLYRQRKRLVPEDKLPAWITADRICDLESKGLVLRCTLCPPGKESQYPHGLSGLRISPQGIDDLYHTDRQRAKERNDENHKQKEQVITIVSLVVTSVIAILAAVLDILFR